MPRPHFRFVYDRDVLDHLRAIDRKHHRTVRDAIETKLGHEPMTESRDRKPLSRPSALGDAWELRCGTDNRFRVFYRADTKASEVRILALGEKRGSCLYLGSKEFEL
jgi:hypothetical protein